LSSQENARRDRADDQVVRSILVIFKSIFVITLIKKIGMFYGRRLGGRVDQVLVQAVIA
jgi:hypothetical protein